MEVGTDMWFFQNFVKKLNIEEKSLLHLNHAKIPELFVELWYMKNNPLILDIPKIMDYWGEDAMKRFIKYVKLDKLEYLRFSLNHVKEIYFILDKPILTLWDCEIFPSCNEQSRIQEWELLTIPELIPCVMKLTLHIDVHLNFIVQYQKLSFLTLYKSISYQSMNQILTYSKLLRQINLVSDNLCIRLDAKLLTKVTSLALSVNMFKQNTVEVLELKNITSFSITHIDKVFTTDWIKCVNYYIQYTKREISLMILSGRYKPYFDLNDINLSDIEHIMLTDFPSLDNESVIKMLNKHPKISYLIFKNCPNITACMMPEIEEILESRQITDFSIYYENCAKIEEYLLKHPLELERVTIEEELDLPITSYQNFIPGTNIAEFHFFDQDPVVSSDKKD